MPPAIHRRMCAAWLAFTGMAQAAPFGTALAIADAALPSWNSGNRIATELALVYSGAQTPAGLAVLATQLDRLTYHSPAGAASVVDADLRGGCALAATDIDADGDADLVAASRWRREIVLYPNQGNGDFGARQTVATGVDAAIALIAARIDGDTVNDLLVLTDFDGRLFWLRGQNGGFESTPRLLHQAVGSPAAVAAGDLDADGDTDVVLLRGGTITNLLNQGNGAFSPGQTLALNAAGILLARFDGDVLPDLAVRLEPNGETRIFRNPGQGAWATANASPLACRNLTAGDLDGDGDLDLLAGRHPDRAVVWLENRGNLEFGPAQNASTAPLSYSLVISGGELLSHFLTDVAARLAGSAVLTLWSGGDPLANSTLELASTFTGQIRFTSETPATVRAEHLAKITVGGAAASESSNLRLTPDGASGCVVTVVAADADQDAMPDAWEILHFANTSRDGTGDFDQDGLVDLAEFQRGTLPTNPDSDGDTLNDGAEIAAGTHPLAADSDADGLTDNVETGTGTYLSATDTGTSPLNPNTDGDRLRDGGEVAKHSDPNNPADCPTLPNVVVILADDLGYNHLGAYRQRSNQTRGTNYDLTLAPTPRIDSLAAAGMLFTDAYAGCTVCGPSRSSLQSGIHSGHIPFKVNNAYVDVTRRTVFLGEIFQRAGFATGYFGKWGLGGAGSGHTICSG